MKKKRYHGSLTVEAVFVVPIFVFAICIFLYLFQYIMLSMSCQMALTATARAYSQHAYLYESVIEDMSAEEETLLGTALKEFGFYELIEDSIFEAEVKAYLNNSTFHSELLIEDSLKVNQVQNYLDDGVIDLCCTYKVEVPFLSGYQIPGIQRVILKSWTGYEVAKLYEEVETEETESSDTTEDVVYMTATGTKYHTHADCTYLKIKVYSTNYSSVKSLRNDQRGKYTACEKCAKGVSLKDDAVVYYTKDGARYHTDKSCSALKRTVNKMKLSEVPAGTGLCSRCAKRDQASAQQAKEDTSK